MPRRYSNPPILEVVCEVRFNETEPWDWTIPGLMYERVSGAFPVKRQEPVLQVAINTTQEGQTIQSGPVAKMQFLRQDGSALIQVQPNILAVTHLRPYPEWPQFRALVLEQLATYAEVSGQRDVARLGLRYINRIQIPTVKFELEDYFATVPTVGAGIPDLFQSFLMRVDILHEEPPRMTLRLTLGSLPLEAPNIAPILLDLDAFTVEGDIPGIDAVPAWLNLAHDRIEAAFDKSFTDRAHRELFEEMTE
jgi:uncharacterized protein (TIGR04255 family)